MIGVDECFARIARMVADALRMAALPADTRLAALGLCLSGCEDERQNAEMAAQFERRYPSVARACVVASDTLGSLLTATPSGGVVLIAGTGSNCLLFNPDQSHVKCGGWGHVLGDYGAAFWIANEAIKTVIEVEENFRREEHDVSGVRDVVFRHFSVHKTSELLTPIYAHFDKTSFAALCRPLALRESFPFTTASIISLSLSVAVEKDDPLAKALFRRAAEDLAKHVNAVLPSAHPVSSPAVIVVPPDPALPRSRCSPKTADFPSFAWVLCSRAGRCLETAFSRLSRRQYESSLCVA
jgi:N-acetylglucosamine kinase